MNVTCRPASWIEPLFVAAVLAAGAPAAAGQSVGKPHPRLVSVESTRCATCHQKLFDGKQTIHAAAEADCTACHQVEVSESATTVALQSGGPELCTTCHDGLTAAAKGELKAPHAPVTDACTNCHDPHATNTVRLLKQAGAELCTGCHAAGDLQPAHGGQITPRVECTRCHQPHGSAQPKLLAASHLHAPFAEKSCEACHRAPFAGYVRLQSRGEALCTACHGDVAEAPSGGSAHAPVRRSATAGQVPCLACHDPHLSANAKLLVQAGPPLCGECHKGVVEAASADTGHAPAGEDCLACHKPHAAAQPKLLNERPPALCTGCHDASDAALKKAHLGADVAALGCTACHTPHGDGQRKLLARHVHPPLLDGCGTCHEGAADKLLEDGGSPLCLACHGDIGEAAQTAKVPHAALEVARCADCHNPHASKQQRLVKSPGAGPCAECHEDQLAVGGEVQHGAIGVVGCRACHEPHGGGQAKLLRAEGNALCLQCHDPRQPAASGSATEPFVQLAGRFEVEAAAARAVKTVILTPDGSRGHPIPNHPVTGGVSPNPRTSVTFKGDLGCLSCHDPHKGASPKLLRWKAAAAMEACLECHPK